MSIHRIQSASLIPKRPFTASVKGHSHASPGVSDFRQLLDVMSEIRGNTPGRWPPLHKLELLKIADLVQEQMNSHLLRVLSADSREPTDIRPPLLPDRLIPLHGRATPGKYTMQMQSETAEDPALYPAAAMESFIPPQGGAAKPTAAKVNIDARGRCDDLETVIGRAAAASGVDPDLVRSVIRVESNFNPDSTSQKGAMGLMQLMPETARELGVRNAYDPEENIRAGTRYLGMLLKRYGGNVDMALAAYNWGMGNLERRPAQMPAETKSYIQNVTRHYRQAKA